jgi:hypothetical protein
MAVIIGFKAETNLFNKNHDDKDDNEFKILLLALMAVKKMYIFEHIYTHRVCSNYPNGLNLVSSKLYKAAISGMTSLRTPLATMSSRRALRVGLGWKSRSLAIC